MIVEKCFKIIAGISVGTDERIVIESSFPGDEGECVTDNSVIPKPHVIEPSLTSAREIAVVWTALHSFFIDPSVAIMATITAEFIVPEISNTVAGVDVDSVMVIAVPC